MSDEDIYLDPQKRYIEIKKKGLNLRLDLELTVDDDGGVSVEIRDSAGSKDSWDIDYQFIPLSERKELDY